MGFANQLVLLYYLLLSFFLPKTLPLARFFLM